MDVLTGIFLKVLTIVGLTHGLRLVGQCVGPRWGGLVLGLPASTALALLFMGWEQGDAFAGEAAEGGLLGLAAAVSLALAYAAALSWGRGLAVAGTVGVVTYLAVAAALSPLRPLPFAWKVAGLVAFVLVGDRLVRFLPRVRGAGFSAVSRAGSLGVRTAVPVVCLLAVLSVCGSVGSFWAGLLGTFPCTSLAVLVVTQLEAGPGKAAETASVFPIGNLSMIGFVAVFRCVCPAYGLAVAMSAAYAAAFAALAVVECGRRVATRTGGGRPRLRAVGRGGYAALVLPGFRSPG
jgi:hypothetical protein